MGRRLLPRVYTVQGYKSYSVRLRPSPLFTFTTLSMLFPHSTTTLLLPYSSLLWARGEEWSTWEFKQTREPAEQSSHTLIQLWSTEGTLSWAAPESEAEVGLLQQWEKITSLLCLVAVMRLKEMHVFFLSFWMRAEGRLSVSAGVFKSVLWRFILQILNALTQYKHRFHWKYFCTFAQGITGDFDGLFRVRHL